MEYQDLKWIYQQQTIKMVMYHISDQIFTNARTHLYAHCLKIYLKVYFIWELLVNKN
jgi:hypothetical protein